MTILHIGGASAGTVLVSVIAIFFLMFAMSFAVGSIPDGQRRFTQSWFKAWFRASLPRMLVAGIFSALLFTGSALSGNSQTNADIDASCEVPLAPNTGNPITEARLTVAISGMNNIAQAALEGDLQTVQTLFVTNDSHNVAHDIDAPLRLSDSSLARALCGSVKRMELETAAPEPDLQTVAREADAIASFLQEARASFDFGTPEPNVGDPCANPIGAVTNQRLTATRIEEAASTLRQVADLADDDEPQAAAQAFSGDAHNITHDIDGPLRTADQGLAEDLCQAVLLLESEFAGEQDTEIIATQARTGADLLEESAPALGITE